MSDCPLEILWLWWCKRI